MLRILIIITKILLLPIFLVVALFLMLHTFIKLFIVNPLEKTITSVYHSFALYKSVLFAKYNIFIFHKAHQLTKRSVTNEMLENKLSDEMLQKLGELTYNYYCILSIKPEPPKLMQMINDVFELSDGDIEKQILGIEFLKEILLSEERKNEKTTST